MTTTSALRWPRGRGQFGPLPASSDEPALASLESTLAEMDATDDPIRELRDSLRELSEGAAGSAGARRVETLVHGVLAVMRLSRRSGGGGARPELIESTSFLSALVSRARPVLAARRLTLELSAGDSRYLHTDPGAAACLMDNIVLAAASIAPVGGLVRVLASRAPGALKVTVDVPAPGPVAGLSWTIADRLAELLEVSVSWGTCPSGTTRLHTTFR